MDSNASDGRQRVASGSNSDGTESPATGPEAPPEGEHVPIWLETSEETSYEALEDGLEVDTAVVGGGIAGITTASKLAESGQSVAVIEEGRILRGVTGHTTAKLTSLHGLVYHHILNQFGEERARRYGEANEAAIDDIEATARARDIDCDFERAPAYTYVESSGERRKVRDEVNAARKVGLPASYEESPPVPFDVEAAIRFDDQAHFHPRKYLLALARGVHGDGSYVFEETKALDIEGGRRPRVETERGDVTADDVVVATHFPFFDHALYFARMRPKRSYVVAARLRDDPPEGMYYKPTTPYFSIRPQPAGEESMVLFGGQNHRTGHGGSTTDRYRKLEREVRSRFDVESIEYRWSTQDFVSADKVPLIGKLAPQVRNVYVATGFGGWGMTNGTVAGTLLSDLVLDRENPWREVFRPTRFTLDASKRELVSHNKHAAKHYVEDYLGRRPPFDPSDLGEGEAEVVRGEGKPIGVHRDEGGELHAVSAVCTHMDCLVEWNDGEQSWDCPCHGSRFGHDGEVLDGPAVVDLPTADVLDAPGEPSSPE